MAASKQHPLYAPIHKGLRSRLFEVSAKAGRMDCADQDTLNGFYDEFGSLVASIRSHHSMEENFFQCLHTLKESWERGREWLRLLCFLGTTLA